MTEQRGDPHADAQRKNLSVARDRDDTNAASERPSPTSTTNRACPSGTTTAEICRGISAPGLASFGKSGHGEIWPVRSPDA